MKDSNTEQGDQAGQEQKRAYFRIDDVIPVVVNPVSKDHHDEPSRILSVTEALNKPELAATADIPDQFGNKWLADALNELNDKLDFMINYFLLKDEGLLTAEKKKVNISASGIQLSVGFPVEVEDIVEIKLLMPSYPPAAVLIYGKTARVITSDDGTNTIAFEFINMTEAVRERIIQYALERQRETKNLD